MKELYLILDKSKGPFNNYVMLFWMIFNPRLVTLFKSYFDYAPKRIPYPLSPSKRYVIVERP